MGDNTKELDLDLKKHIAWQIPGNEDCHRCDGNGNYCKLPLKDNPSQCPQVACMTHYVPCEHSVLCSCQDDNIRKILKELP